MSLPCGCLRLEYSRCPHSYPWGALADRKTPAFTLPVGAVATRGQQRRLAVRGWEGHLPPVALPLQAGQPVQAASQEPAAAAVRAVLAHQAVRPVQGAAGNRWRDQFRGPAGKRWSQRFGRRQRRRSRAGNRWYHGARVGRKHRDLRWNKDARDGPNRRHHRQSGDCLSNHGRLRDC